MIDDAAGGVLVPSAFLRLVHAHAVDVAALRRELVGDVRTRTWPSGGTGIALDSLPDDFPRFHGTVSAGRLTLKSIDLSTRVRLVLGRRASRIIMPMPDLPETLLAAFTGRRLDEMVCHAAIGPDAIVMGTSEGVDRGGRPVLTIAIDMDWVQLRDGDGRTGTPAPRTGTPVEEMIVGTHEALADPRMPLEALVDPRSWEKGFDHRVVGITPATSGPDGAPAFDVRFPYDPERVAAIGRGGFGAWFDRDAYAWRVPDTDAGRTGLRSFLEMHADVVVGPDGRLHTRRQG